MPSSRRQFLAAVPALVYGATAMTEAMQAVPQRIQLRYGEFRDRAFTGIHGLKSGMFLDSGAPPRKRFTAGFRSAMLSLLPHTTMLLATETLILPGFLAQAGTVISPRRPATSRRVN